MKKITLFYVGFEISFPRLKLFGGFEKYHETMLENELIKAIFAAGI